MTTYIPNAIPDQSAPGVQPLRGDRPNLLKTALKLVTAPAVIAVGASLILWDKMRDRDGERSSEPFPQLASAKAPTPTDLPKEHDMDRDPQENIVDPVERVSPSTGNNDTGDNGDQQKEIHKTRQERGTEPDRRDQANPNGASDRDEEIANPGSHGGGGDTGRQPVKPSPTVKGA